MSEKLKTLISNISGINIERIQDDSRIEEDLRIYGDDAVELLITYGKEFNVDVSRFMAADYFSGEGLDIIGAIKRAITGKPKPLKKELTINHLEKGIIAGRLDEDVINS